MANFPVVVTTGAWQGIKPTLARALARKIERLPTRPCTSSRNLSSRLISAAATPCVSPRREPIAWVGAGQP